MSYEGNMKLAEAKIILKTTLPLYQQLSLSFLKETLQIWYKPIKVDSLALIVTKIAIRQFFIQNQRPKKDTLSITALQNGTLNFRDFTLETVTPLVGFDNSKIQLTNKDSTAVAFKTEYDDFNQKLFLISRKNH
jgi:hypothetical protein